MLAALSVLALAPQAASAEVLVPPEEYVGYLDSHGIYTVIGNVKNGLDHAILPSVTISVLDGDTTRSQTILHVPLAPGTEAPFKAKFHDIGTMPVLLPAQVTFEATQKDPIPLAVLYDETLVTHEDGHLTGRIQNIGNHTVYGPKILAVIHGHEGVLDVGQNIEHIDMIEPGQTVEFSMYPDPSITDEVSYYSCFAPVDTTVIPVTARKDGGDYDFRYDSGAWYFGAEFDESGTVMTINGYNSYPLETYANFEFPPVSGDEEFSVTVNGEPIEFIQSIDEMGFWHVAYTVEPRSQGIVRIEGFEKGLPPDLPRIPAWIKQNAAWWAAGKIADSEFLEGIDLLLEKQVITAPQREVVSAAQWSVPEWVKDAARWWSEERISDEEFLEIAEYLVRHKVIVV